MCGCLWDCVSECRGICTYETDKAANKLDEVGGDGVLRRRSQLSSDRQESVVKDCRLCGPAPLPTCKHQILSLLKKYRTKKKRLVAFFFSRFFSPPPPLSLSRPPPSLPRPRHRSSRHLRPLHPPLPFAGWINDERVAAVCLLQSSSR